MTTRPARALARVWITVLAAFHGTNRASWGETIRLDVTRDAWVSGVGREADGNNGAAPRLKLKSYQEMTLLDVDPAPLRGRIVRRARLHLKTVGGERLWRVTVSSVSAEWFEGNGTGYAIEPGAATFKSRRHNDLPWSISGGDLCHVVLGSGGSLWRMADASAPDRDGWQTIAVDPLVLAARAAGLSSGFLIFDDTGTEWKRTGDRFDKHIFPNRFVYSRDQNRASAPYFTVELGDRDRTPPGPPTELRLDAETASLPGGEALVSWTTPADAGPAGVIGFLAALDGRAVAHELVPLAAAKGERVQMHLHHLKLEPGSDHLLAIRAIDAAGNPGRETALGIRVSNRAGVKLPLKLDRARPASPRPADRAGLVAGVIDELDKIDPRSGKVEPAEPDDYLTNNHVYNAAQGVIRLAAARGEAAAFQVVLRKGAQAPRAEVAFETAGASGITASLGRLALVNTPRGTFPDPVIPWGQNDPLADDPAIRYIGLHVEFQIPHGIRAGKRRATLRLTESQTPPVELPIELDVLDFDLPDALSFVPEMNCYGLPENERDYYRLAHRHRTALNRVPYSQRGQVTPGCAPEWNPKTRKLDWTRWDRRFGPLLDGSAFADLPRKQVPVDIFYLPLHENWPTPFDSNYKGGVWADECLPRSYFETFTYVTKAMDEHFARQGWNRTLFEGFLNNKNNFKEPGWSRGSSIWLLDEPGDFQDFWALRVFGGAFQNGIGKAGGRGPRMVFRADISRPMWQRDALDGLLDVLVVSSAMREYPQLVFERKRRYNQIVFEYGTSAAVEGSAYQPVAWCLDVFTRGADGVVPWQTIGTGESWQKGDTLSLLYPPRPGDRSPLPVPSLRLKAYRRGQQDVEYLALFAAVGRHPRWALREVVESALGGMGKRTGTGAAGEDAGRIEYAAVRPGNLHALRQALAAELAAKTQATARPTSVVEIQSRRIPARPARVGDRDFPR